VQAHSKTAKLFVILTSPDVYEKRLIAIATLPMIRTSAAKIGS